MVLVPEPMLSKWNKKQNKFFETKKFEHCVHTMLVFYLE